MQTRIHHASIEAPVLVLGGTGKTGRRVADRLVPFCGRGKARLQRCESVVPRALGRAPTDFTGFAARVGASGARRLAA